MSFEVVNGESPDHVDVVQDLKAVKRKVNDAPNSDIVTFRSQAFEALLVLYKLDSKDDQQKCKHKDVAFLVIEVFGHSCIFL